MDAASHDPSTADDLRAAHDPETSHDPGASHDSLAALEELMEVTTALATERHLETLLNAVVSAARRLTAAEGGRILVLDRTGRELHCLVGQNEAAPELSGLARSVPLYRAANSFNLDEPNVYAAVTGRVVNVADVRAYTGLDFTALYAHEAATAFRTRAFVAVPLRSVEGFTLGVLQLINVRMDHRRMDGWPLDGRPLEAGDAGRALSPDFERVVRCFAAHAAVAIANARLFDENRRLIRQLDRARSDLEEENTRLRNAQAGPGNGVIGDSAPFQVALALLQRAAPATVPVLLLGETGTGKEVFAKMLHAASPRSARPFVVQNCAALPEHLLESELFGYRRGAFTGAIADRAGLVHAAQGGTLFLDEVGDMPLGLQSKILRMLGQGEVRRVGDTRTETVDVRIVAATNADLAAKIAQGQFREDLYYRLQVFPITLPPLRDRTSDIPALIEHFLAAACAPLGRRPPALTPEALACLVNWRFPGNVRELKNIVERAVLLCDGDRLDLPHLPPELMASTALPAPIMTPEEEGGGLRLMVQNYEAAIIEVKLRETGWNQSRAADLLRISRRSLVEKLSRYDIRQPGRV